MFESDRGPFAVILVGALFVGSMSTVWHGDVKPASRRVTSLASSAERAAELQAPRLLPRGAEMGRFNMGSTIILLLPPGVGRWSDDVHVGKVVRLGQVIGQWP
jgi:phosphatidylserine decarboxylase